MSDGPIAHPAAVQSAIMASVLPDFHNFVMRQHEFSFRSEAR
jgi:hypothetical protein